MPPPLIFLFDIDGTLLSEAVAVHRAAFGHACERVYGISLSLNGIVTAGRTDSWILEEALGGHVVIDNSILQRMPRAFTLMEAYVEECLGDLRHTVLPGVPGILDSLRAKGAMLGLLTGNLQGIATAKLRRAGLDGYFLAGGYGAESRVRAHLVPAALHAMGKIMGREIAPHEVVLIGDTPLDIEAARTSGTRVAAVATGRYSLDELRKENPDLLLSSLADAGALQGLMAL